MERGDIKEDSKDSTRQGEMERGDIKEDSEGSTKQGEMERMTSRKTARVQLDRVRWRG